MIRAGIFVAILLLAGASAYAKHPDAEKSEARRHYDAGLAHFNLREYPQAIDEFQAAYRLLPDPVFLYNLGQAYRLSNDAEQALYFYRTYIRMAPDSANRGEVDERIATLEKLIADKRNAERPPDHTIAPTDNPNPAQATPATTAAASPATSNEVARSSTPIEPRDRKPVYKRWWFWTIGGVIVAGAAVGLGVGLGMQKSASFNANVGTFGPNAITVRF